MKPLRPRDQVNYVPMTYPKTMSNLYQVAASLVWWEGNHGRASRNLLPITSPDCIHVENIATGVGKVFHLYTVKRNGQGSCSYTTEDGIFTILFE